MTDWALPEINLHLCARCGTCVARCPTGAVEMGPEGPFIARPADCTYCALCDAICSQGAITCTYEIVWGMDTRAGNERERLGAWVSERVAFTAMRKNIEEGDETDER